MSGNINNSQHTFQLKSAIRSTMRTQRNKLSRIEQQRAANRLCLRLTRQPEFRSAQHIALYMPNDGEISPLQLMGLSRYKAKRFYLPRVKEGVLHFARYRISDKLRKNRFGINEPLAGAPIIAATKLDLVCVPLVAFDPQGRRLGMGGGFYDRCFAFKKHAVSPRLVGVAHALQKHDPLPSDLWDIPMDLIMSDRETIR